MGDLKASGELRAIREQLKPAVHGGLHLSSEEVAELLSKISTVIELATENEEDLALLQAAMAARTAGKPCLRLIKGGSA